MSTVRILSIAIVVDAHDDAFFVKHDFFADNGQRISMELGPIETRAEAQGFCNDLAEVYGKQNSARSVKPC